MELVLLDRTCIHIYSLIRISAYLCPYTCARPFPISACAARPSPARPPPARPSPAHQGTHIPRTVRIYQRRALIIQRTKGRMYQTRTLHVRAIACVTITFSP